MKKILFFTLIFLFSATLLSARTWTAGTYTAEGEFAGMKDAQTVRIRMTNGKTVAVPLNRLSADDQKFANEQARAQEEENPFQEEPAVPVSSSALPRNAQPGDRWTVTVNGVEFPFRWCPAGTFQMGSSKDELGHDFYETQHEVRLTQGFWMLETEVTQAQWKAVMNGQNPSFFKGDSLPVESVVWGNCAVFCDEISEKLGLKIKLPTEAQWEYACRAGTQTALNSGRNLSSGDESCFNLGQVGWYYENSDRKTHPVGQKKPNAWGLYDMHGNVWEWCADYYESEIGWNSQEDPCHMTPGSGANGRQRVSRGGSWYSYAKNCRSAKRNSDFYEYRNVKMNPVVAVLVDTETNVNNYKKAQINAQRGNHGFRVVLLP